jgi:hypothetical protein
MSRRARTETVLKFKKVMIEPHYSVDQNVGLELNEEQSTERAEMKPLRTAENNRSGHIRDQTENSYIWHHNKNSGLPNELILLFRHNVRDYWLLAGYKEKKK